MKKILFIVLALFSVALQAQNNEYRSAMIQNIQLVDTSNSYHQLSRATAIFGALYEAGSQWEPLYYEIFALTKQAYANITSDQKETVLTTAERLMDKLPQDNDEVLVLKAYHAQAMLGIHRELWQKYLPIINQSLKRAEEINSNNPRIYYLKGLMVYFMPQEMGGGKEKGLQLFRQAREKFSNFQSKNEYAPIWGKTDTQKIIESAQ
jgi:hypothetical protein